MASQPSAMPASRWRSNRFLLQPSRLWIWFFIVRAVLAGSVTSASDRRADTDSPEYPESDTCAHKELIKKVVDASTPELFVKYFIDCTPPSWGKRDEYFVRLLQRKKISPEQVVKHVTDSDITKVLNAFDEKYRDVLKYNHLWGQNFLGPINRLLALYERLPDDWLPREHKRFYETLFHITWRTLVKLRVPLLGFAKVTEALLYLSSSERGRPEEECRMWFQLAVANLPSTRPSTFQLSTLELLFNSKWWSYSDLQLRTFSHVFWSFYPYGRPSSGRFVMCCEMFHALLRKLYCNDELKLPNNYWGHLGFVIWEMFWAPDSKPVRDGLLKEFKQLEDVVYPIRTFLAPSTNNEAGILIGIILSSVYKDRLTEHAQLEGVSPEDLNRMAVPGFSPQDESREKGVVTRV